MDYEANQTNFLTEPFGFTLKYDECISIGIRTYTEEII